MNLHMCLVLQVPYEGKMATALQDVARNHAPQVGVALYGSAHRRLHMAHGI